MKRVMREFRQDLREIKMCIRDRITTQCIAGLGSLMPLVAELWAGEPWLEAIYPHGQLIWTALSLAGWLPALLAGMLWYKLRGGRIPGRRWAATILGAVAWALILWAVSYTHIDVYKRQPYGSGGG